LEITIHATYHTQGCN